MEAVFNIHNNTSNKKLLRWRNELCPYTFRFYHHPGKCLPLEDYLSRLSKPTDNPSILHNPKQEINLIHSFIDTLSNNNPVNLHIGDQSYNYILKDKYSSKNTFSDHISRVYELNLHHILDNGRSPQSEDKLVQEATIIHHINANIFKRAAQHRNNTLYADINPVLTRGLKEKIKQAEEKYNLADDPPPNLSHT